MKAMILAAGLGSRMRPLTDERPKPLLEVGGRPLIGWHLQRLAAAGIHEVVINHHYLGEQIERALGRGEDYGLHIRYSPETERLETGGGIVRALPLLGSEPFVVVNGDIWTDYPFSQLCRRDPGRALAHLVMVPNPGHHRGGDFRLDDRGRVSDAPSPAGQALTYSGIALLSPALFTGRAAEPFPLVEPLRRAIRQDRVTGERYDGRWWDIGTPERLRELDALLDAEGGRYL